MPQDAATGEVLAILVAMANTPSVAAGSQQGGVQLELVVDCAAVRDSIHRLQASGLPDGSRRLDGMYRNVAELMPGRPRLTITKVKAHRSYRQAAIDGDLEAWAGNEQADLAAKKSLAIPTCNQALVDEEKLLGQQVQAVLLRAVAVHRHHRVLAAATGTPLQLAWRQVAMRATRLQQGNRANTPHVLDWLATGFQCRLCLRTWDAAPAAGDVCKGLPRALDELLRHRGAGHRLVVREDIGMGAGRWILFCTRCGGYTSERIRLLSGQCPGNVGTRVTFLKRLAMEGLDPSGRRKLGRGWVLPAGIGDGHQACGPVAGVTPLEAVQASGQQQFVGTGRRRG
jgi:hypothetical protein